MIGGVTAEPDGDGWVLREADRSADEGVLGRVARADGGLHVEGGPAGFPAGPYGSIDAVIDAVETWRSARFDQDR